MAIMFQPFKKYATFTGRARRSELWLFFLLYLIVYGVAMTLAASMADGSGQGSSTMAILGIVALVFFVPMLAVNVRRLHDIDKSGWWLLIGIVPLIGLILIYWFCQDGTPGPNRFGESPKGQTVAEVMA